MGVARSFGYTGMEVQHTWFYEYCNATMESQCCMDVKEGGDVPMWASWSIIYLRV